MLQQYRVQFNQHFASYNAGGIGFFTAKVANACVLAGIGSALDALPAGTAAVVAGPARHMLRLAHAAEIPTNETDRQILVAQAAAVA